MGLFNFLKKQEKTKNHTHKEVIKSYIIEFPYRGKIECVDTEEETNDDEYITGKKVYLYLKQDNIDGLNSSWNNSDIISFINNNTIKNKISDMQLYIKSDGICNIYINVYEELTSEDKDYILNFVKAQVSDGWGEGDFDYIYNKKTKELYYY